MRILVATHNYPRFSGDRAGGFVATLASAAAKRGDQVVVVAPHAPGIATDEILDGVRVLRFRYAPEPAELIAYRGDLHQRAARNLTVMAALPSFLLAFRRALRRAEAEHEPHVLHAHWWFPAGWLATAARAPMIVTCHGTDVGLLARRPLRMLARRTLSRARATTAVSTFLATALEARLGKSIAPVLVSPLPVDPRPFTRFGGASKSSPPTILYSGNLVPSKGVEVLMEAFALLRREGIDWHLLIQGDGPLRPLLEERARRLGISAAVAWKGFVTRDQMPEAYARSSVTVLPSVGEEGLGLTLVESLMARTPVVGTDRGGIPDVIRHDQTGLLARAGDPVDLAAQLGRLARDPETRVRLAERGHRHVMDRHAPENAMGLFFRLYDQAATDTKHTPHGENALEG